MIPASFFSSYSKTVGEYSSILINSCQRILLWQPGRCSWWSVRATQRKFYYCWRLRSTTHSLLQAKHPNSNGVNRWEWNCKSNRTKELAMMMCRILHQICAKNSKRRTAVGWLFWVLNEQLVGSLTACLSVCVSYGWLRWIIVSILSKNLPVIQAMLQHFTIWQESRQCKRSSCSNATWQQPTGMVASRGP